MQDIDLLWSAGSGGFVLSDEDADREAEAFEACLAAFSAIRSQVGTTSRVRFHFVSSAGGLFESQRLVDGCSLPEPLRPYGRLKLRQEQLAEVAVGASDLHVYRLSSVYGRIRPGRRSGLVSTLVFNTLRQRVSTIRGRLDTLRDYVWADDIGRYIYERMMNQDIGGDVVILASGRPASIHDVRSLVHRVSGKTSYIHCASSDNAEHITFSPSVLPSGFEASSMETNVRRLIADTLQSDIAFVGESR